jgi:penicillin-binding protein 1A
MSARARRRHRRTGRKKNPFLLAVVVFSSIAAMAVLSIGIWAESIFAGTDIDNMKEVTVGSNTVVYAADGSRLGVIQSDISRTPIPIEKIPEDLQHATVAIEDSRFYEHDGIDIEGIGRALYNNFSAGETKEGGSTITQQLARNLYIADPKRDVERKIREAAIAMQLEDRHSKEWILDEYLNTASYGTVLGRTAVGVEAAADTYFSKHANQLDLAESALLAGLPQSPSQYNPILDPKDALRRRNEVLDAMADKGYISQTQADETKSEEIKLTPGSKYTEIREPYVFDYVEQQLIEKYGVNTVRNGGLKVYTTIDPDLQGAAQDAVDSCSVCYGDGGPASALASVNPTNGEIVALASSQRYSKDSQFNFAAHAQRQPGSSFKVYDLTAAIKEGIDPDSTYYDGTSPANLDPGDGTTWEVNNAEPGGGVVPLTAATWESVNVVFAKLSLDVGLDEIAKTAYDMGITTPLGIKDNGEPCKEPGPDCFIPPADSIGGLTTGVTPLEQATAYATLASGGIHHDPTAVKKIVFPDGTVDEPSSDEGKRVLTPGQAYTVTKVLEGVITSGTGAGYTSIGCPAAGKTGTSEDLSDAWFVGYTPLYSTAVWTGHPLSRDSTGFGGPTSGPVWRSFMEAAQGSDCPDFPVPENLPELSSFHGLHTSSSSSSSCSTDAVSDSGTGSNYSSCTTDTSTTTDEQTTKDENNSNDNGGNGNYAPGKGQNPAPSPAPAPTPAPEPPPVDPGNGGITP